jgi:Inosine-uridine preferring nucleoside hydrolase
MNILSQLSHRHSLQHLTSVAGAVAVMGLVGLTPVLTTLAAQPSLAPAKRIPVILATDIGDDIDDTWALGLLLKSPELDLKLVVGEYGKQQYRAKLLAKFLKTVQHGNIPIGVGLDIEPRGEGPQAAWVKDFDLSSYPGKVYPDGVQAIIDTVQASKEPVTIISIGPMPNVAAALAREPKLASRARLVGNSLARTPGVARRGGDSTT